MSLATADAFSETKVDVGGVSARIVEAGSGAPVLALGAGFAGSAAHRALAANFHVIAFDASESDQRKAGEAAAAWLTGKAIEKAGLIGIGASAPAALWAAQALGERASALVLSAPQGLPIGASADETHPLTPLLRGVLTPKIVLVGYTDKAMPKDALTLFKKGLSRSNVMLIYNAGADIAGDRPEVFASIAGDFLDRQDRFRFYTRSVALD